MIVLTQSQADLRIDGLEPIGIAQVSVTDWSWKQLDSGHVQTPGTFQPQHVKLARAFAKACPDATHILNVKLATHPVNPAGWIACEAVGDAYKKALLPDLIELGLTDPVEMTVVSRDVEGDGKNRTRVKLGCFGITLCPDDCGELTIVDGYGEPILLEYRDGIPYLVVWGDINQEDPTHTIDLSGAFESKRKKQP